MKPQTAQQINDPQTGQVRTSRHSALSELMIQNAELREQIRVLQSAYDSLSQMKEKQVASRIETDELRAENEDLKSENSKLLAPTIELLLKIRPTAQYQCFHAIVEDLDKELDRLRGLVEGKP